MKLLHRIASCLVALILLSSSIMPTALAAEITDEAVLAVIEQLNNIDTLQQMQKKRDTFKADGRLDYTVNYTIKNQKIIDDHANARANYDNYINTMFAARIAAQQAYDALTAEQQAQIDPALVAKLDQKLDNVVTIDTYAVTPSDNEYTFEAVDGGSGYGYEVSNHMVSEVIPQTFVLVDTSDGKTSWTPNGLYEPGKSNYEVVYCCDVTEFVRDTTNYKRLNLEDSTYFSKAAAEHLRAIVLNSYPYLSVDEMKAQLKADGVDAAFADSLTRADMIAAVQQAIWNYANPNDDWFNVGYFASFSVPPWNGNYYTVLHDYSNECWDWFKSGNRTFDHKAEYRVNNLVHYLCSLDGVPAADNAIVISEANITRASLTPGANGTYELGMYVRLNTGAGAGDNLSITAASYDANGTLTDRVSYVLSESDTYELSVRAKYGDRITVTVEGTQDLGRGAYFYEPEGGRTVSQCLIGVGGGETRVRAEKSFTFNKDIDMGLRIYKTAADTGLPLSEITFDVYKVELNEGETVSETPTEEEVAKYATEANKAGSVTTDVTGYASLPLDEGLYLVIEQHNTDKVKAPVPPFYIPVPMPVETEVPGADGKTEIVIEYQNIVSIYPKNEPTEPPTPPPPPPPPINKVYGQFSIVKHDVNDTSVTLSGASFQVFRTATTEDTDVQIITSNGINYAVVPVTVNGANLILTTDDNGTATSPELLCDTYFLVETKAPFGYEPLDEAIPVTVKSNLVSTTEVLYIPNTPGSILPETGGAGTKWMIAIGSVVAMCTAVLLITEKKMSVYR